jgi:hypothetical protein
MQGVLHYNTERTAFAAQLDDDHYEVEPWPDTQVAVLTGPGKQPLLAVMDGCEGLKAHTLYRLEELPTIVNANADIDADDDDDDDDFDDDDADDEDADHGDEDDEDDED